MAQRAVRPVLYAVMAGPFFAEDALFFGRVLPGESAVAIGDAVDSANSTQVIRGQDGRGR
ncbi:hypothetical protein [Streptomyces sp. MI02-7b]|uniref:hypothetical protein n=1 Tax=Streptomyces sp. MI02-7b TaxID=462941 RepID=UPI0029A3709E|nr:hypothetical protein [Streptomyces sp. MI02-7b]MDX3075867.1 hypothetical protein [Streptomyces sp. MI02-7b]